MTGETAPRPATLAEEVIWHDVECGGYGADLDLWAEHAGRYGAPVLELGCGTGRVALALGRAGHEVVGVDANPALVAELDRRAAAAGLPVTARCADVCDLELGRRFGLVIAPMQIVQMLGGREARLAMLERIRHHLAPGACFAAAIVEGVPTSVFTDEQAGDVLPDVREVDGRVYSSLPLGASVGSGVLAVRRRRESVSPGGELTVSQHVDRLYLLDADTFEAEGREAGLRSAGRRPIPAGDSHVPSTLVLMEAR